MENCTLPPGTSGMLAVSLAELHCSFNSQKINNIKLLSYFPYVIDYLNPKPNIIRHSNLDLLFALAQGVISTRTQFLT